jgi:hypothetical protein
MTKHITIKWDNYPEHKILVQKNGYEGYCITHNHFVTEQSRCPVFPCQTAMWHDLWRSQLKISSNQK